MAKTLTAANSVLMLTIVDLFAIPQKIEGYATEDAFSTTAVQPAEVMMGVDGRMSAGYVPYMVPMPISIMADSPSNTFFDAWLQAQKAAGEIYFADGEVFLPGTQQRYILTKGVMTEITVIGAVKKVLQPRTFTITWQGVDPVPV